MFSCLEELRDHCGQAHDGRGMPQAMPARKRGGASLGGSVRPGSRSGSGGEQKSPTASTPRGLPAPLTPLTPPASARGATNPSWQLARTAVWVLGAVAAPQCPSCFRRFASQDALRAHLLQPASQRRPPCGASGCVGCGAAYASEEECAAHEALCDRVLRCPGCPRRFATEALLRGHVALSMCQASACRGCGQLEASRTLAEEHERTCDKVQECPGCQRKYASRAELLGHLMKPAKARPSCPAALCVGCGFACSSEKERIAHEVLCWRVFSCPGCNARLGSADAFQAHLRDREARSVLGCTAAQCGTCGLVFSAAEERDVHAQTHRAARRVAARSASDSDSGQPSSRASGCRPALPPAAILDLPGADAPAREAAVSPQPSEAAAVPEDLIRDLYVELASLRGEALRQRVRQLQLHWHPDRAWRQNVDPSVAVHVFIFVQRVWEARVAKLGL